MSEYKRLTTENPQGNMESMLNITKVVNREVYIRNWNGEADLSLVDYCKEQYKSIYGRSIDADLEEKITAEEFGEFMDGDDLLSLFYWTAVGYTELRERLKMYEDSGLSPEEVIKVNDFERSQCAKLLGENSRLNQEHNEAMTMLKQMEWGAIAMWGNDRRCVVCQNLKSQGHKEGCELAGLLKERQCDG